MRREKTTHHPVSTAAMAFLNATVLLTTALLWAPAAAHASLGEFPEDPGNLEVFGYSIATADTNEFKRDLRETAKFSNVALLRGWSIDFGELMVEAKKNGQKAIVSLHFILFEEADPSPPVENDWVLRDDYQQAFFDFVAEHGQHLGPDMVAAFYPADEPYWNGISEAGYAAANTLIKKMFNSIPTYVSLSVRDAEIVEGTLDSLTIQGGLVNPIPSDWVGYHAYGILDPATDRIYQNNLAIVKSHMHGTSQFLYLIDGYWNANVHGANKIVPSDMDQVARNYYELARADPDAIGLGVFIWDSFGSNVGTRDLPDNVLREHIRIGTAISGKCGIPDDIPPLQGESVEWFRQCRFYTSVEWTDFEGMSGSGKIADFGTDESGLFWFFNAENLELLVRVLDGCSINDHFWVFTAANTNVNYTLSVTDAATGVQWEYTNPLGTLAPAVADTAAFATCSIPSEPLGPDHGIPTVWAAGADCVPSPTRHCFRQGRFKIVLDWYTVRQTGPGRVVPYGTDESGLFWFFSEDNWEMLVKVLDGCGINQHYWVFAAAATNVGYDLTVTDTTTGQVQTYQNPLGQIADPIGDTDAFATCP